MKCSYKYIDTDMYEVSFHTFSTYPMQIEGVIQSYPFLFTTNKTQWIFSIGINPFLYIDRSIENCYLGPLACKYYHEGWYKDADKMNKEIGYKMVVELSCYYLGISESDIRIYIDDKIKNL